jgi:hypothetical protein
MGTKAAIDESSPRVVVKARRARTTPFTNDDGMNTDCIRRRTRILNIPHIFAAGLLQLLLQQQRRAYLITLLYLLPAPLCSPATNTARPAVSPRFSVS